MSFVIGSKGKSDSASSKDNYVTQLLLEEVITQLKLVNLNLSRLVGEELTEQDIEEHC